MVLANNSFVPVSGSSNVDDCLIAAPRWNNTESTIDGPAFLDQHAEEEVEGKIQAPASSEMLGLPFMDEFTPSSTSSSASTSSFKHNRVRKGVAFRTSFVDELLGMAIPSSTIMEGNSSVGDGLLVHHREGSSNQQILKRRRSLDDDYQRKQVKREKSKQLYERRRSLDSCVALRNPAYNPLSRGPTLSMEPQVPSRTPKRSNLWTYEEEVFLVAAVMECFLRRGSLTSNRGRDGCWSEIKSFFDLFITNYNKKYNKNKKTGTERASSALYRHFKTLKERISKDPSKDLREYYHRFQFEYNRNNCLLQAPSCT